MSTVNKVTTVVSDVVTVNFYATAYNAEGSIQDTMIEAGSTRGNFVRDAIWVWGTEFPDLTPLIESVTPLRYVTSIKVTLSADTTAGCSDGRDPTAQLVFNKEKYGWNTMVSGTTTFEYDMTQGEPESGGLVEIETVAFNAWNYPVGEVTFNVSIAVTVAVEEAPTIEGTQLVLSGNRVLAYGDNCFVSMGGTVICEETGKAYQNATVVTHTGSIPADINKVGYEYHAGVFIPCAPYGKGEGDILVSCEECGTPKSSGILSKTVNKVIDTGILISSSSVPIPPTGGDWSALAYGNGRFVAVSKGSKDAAFKVNGSEWILSTLPASADWHSVVFGNGLFVALAQGGEVAYSSDGIEWTASTMPTFYSGSIWHNVVYGNGYFVAFVTSGASTSAHTLVARSTDGSAWETAYTSTATFEYLYSLNNEFVAEYEDYAPSSTTSTAQYIMHSTDGVTWSQNITLNALPTKIIYAEGIYIGVSGTHVVYTEDSTLATWTGTHEASAYGIVGYGNGKFLFIPESGDEAAYSESGKGTWTKSVLPHSVDVAAVQGSAGYFVILGTNETLETKDGATFYTDSYNTLTTADGTDVTELVKAVLAG